MTQKSDLAARFCGSEWQFMLPVKLARRLLRKHTQMVAVGRVLLWTVALVAPGGFLLVPVLAASSLKSGGGVAGLHARVTAWFARIRRSTLQRYWTKS